MKKFSFLIVCLCAGLAFVSQAQDTQRVAPASGDAPSLNGGRPSPWERPIGPGPVDHPNGGSCSGDVTDDDGSGGSPLDALTKATIRPNRPASGDTPSLQRKRPRDWDEPIPGPIPHRFGGLDVDGDDSGDPHSSVGTSLDGLIKATIRPNGSGGGDAPSLNGARPSPWDRPIGPRPVEYANGGSGSGDVTDDDCSGGSPLDCLEKGTVRPGTVLPIIKPGGDQTNGGLRPGVDHGPIVWAPSHESGGSPMVADMIDGLLNGSTDVPDMNGDGKADISDVTTAINRLLRAQ